MSKFNHVISFGYLCPTSQDLERIGLRDSSGPFDWSRTQDLEQIINLVENNFKDFLNLDYLYQDLRDKNVYTNVKHNIVLNHDFNQYESLSSQLPNVKQKYQRRIDRFYNNIQEPTLFIRDLSGVNDLKYVEENFAHINKVLRKYNSHNKIIFTSRNDLESQTVKIYQVKTEYIFGKQKTFIKTNKDLYTYLDQEIDYPTDKRRMNYKIYKKKKFFSYFNKISNKIQGVYKNISKQNYEHYNQENDIDIIEKININGSYFS